MTGDQESAPIRVAGNRELVDALATNAAGRACSPALLPPSEVTDGLEVNVEIIGGSAKSANDRRGIMLRDSLEGYAHVLGKLAATLPAKRRAPGLVEIATRTGPLVSQPFYLLLYIGCGQRRLRLGLSKNGYDWCYRRRGPEIPGRRCDAAGSREVSSSWPAAFDTIRRPEMLRSESHRAGTKQPGIRSSRRDAMMIRDAAD